jgi:hypothetical protein
MAGRTAILAGFSPSITSPPGASAMPGTIEHRWHGDKTRRAYVSRWGMFTKHRFNPHSDLKRNSYGVLEFAGNKPDLERIFDNYLRDREEDSNIIG